MPVVLWPLLGLIILFGVVVLRGAPYVPSRRKDLEEALNNLYELSGDDLLVDIGSGDGLVLRAAAKKGARAIGYEINPVLVVVSRLLSISQARVSTKWADFWKAKLPAETTVVYTFGESRHIEKMAAFVDAESKRLKKPLYLISYGFESKKYRPQRRSATHFLYYFDPLQ